MASRFSRLRAWPSSNNRFCSRKPRSAGSGIAAASSRSAIPDPAERGFLLQNLLFEDGHARWRLNLEAMEREMSVLVGFPPLPDNAVYSGPTLFLGGARSDYLLAEHEPAIRRRFPNARIERIEDAGHWVHAEQPAAFLRIVEPFLA